MAPVNDDRGVAEVLLTAPAGVALLHALETECRTDVHRWDCPIDSRPDAVDAAVDLVGELSFGGLMQRAVAAADRFAGPWMPSSPADLTVAYRLAPARATIARVVAERFVQPLCAPFDGDGQEWWSTTRSDTPQHPRPWDHEAVYSCGEFSWGGLWTVTRPPDELHHDLIEFWELNPYPIGRWALPVRPGACIYEIHHVDDWARLVAAYSKRPARGHSGWELPGPNQHLAETVGVEIASSGRAARHDVTVAMPDWKEVAVDDDGVHLTWMGMLAAEGHVSEVPGEGEDTATMLRYWASERTLWLCDVFGDPEPRPGPVIVDDRGSIDGDEDGIGIDVADHPGRLATDQHSLRRRLGCDPVRTRNACQTRRRADCRRTRDRRHPRTDRRPRSCARRDAPPDARHLRR